MKKSLGFTTVEVIAVIAVLALVITLGVRMVNQHYHYANIALVERNIQQVMSGLHGFYEAHCSLSAPPSVSTASLLSGGYLSDAQFTNNPFGSPLEVRLLWGQPSRLEVSAVFNDAARYQHMLGADSRSGNRLNWNRLPRLLTNSNAIEIMQFKRLHEPAACH